MKIGARASSCIPRRELHVLPGGAAVALLISRLKGREEPSYFSSCRNIEHLIRVGSIIARLSARDSTRGYRIVMKNRVFLTATVLATVAYWALLIFRVPLLQNLPWWFWEFRDTPFDSPIHLIGSGALSALILTFVLTNPLRHKLNLALLILLGYTLQLNFGLVEGRGVAPFHERLTKSGQIDCIRVAAKGYSAWDLATRYEEYLQHTELWRYDYLKTKPPGTLLFFVLTERATGWVSQPASEEERIQHFVTFATYLLPLLAAITLIPLFLLSRLFLKAELAIFPAVLFLFTPSMNLISMSIDQFLLPLLCLLCVWLGALSIVKRNLSLALLAGLSAFVSTYVSFSLLALLPLCPLLMTGMWITQDRTKGSRQDLVGMLAGFFTGFLVMVLAFRFALGYDMLLRFSNAVAAHGDIKSWMPGIENVITFAFVGFLDFTCGLGIALTAVFVAHLVFCTREVTQKRISALGFLSLALFLVLLGLALFGMTKAETARLWLFLMPLVCVVAVGTLSQRFQNRIRAATVLIVVLQFVTVVLTKRFEDLWRAIP